MENSTGKDNTTDQDRLIPLTKWPEYHPWPPVGGLRHLVFNAKKNGFEHCIVRRGGRVLISERRFFGWALDAA